MANGLLIRDLFRTYRELRFSDSGSITLSEIEHNAYSHRLTVEITHYDAPRAINEKTLPTNTHWGYLTSFKGSAVCDNTPVKFAKQRVYQEVNNGIWAYHQATETLNLNTAINESGINSLISGGVLGEATDALVRIFVKAKDALGDAVDNAANWLVGSRPFEGGESSDPLSGYTAFPIVSPFPDIFKFKADIPASFLFRLESFYLVNPAVYILSNPSETGDATEGEDQYPAPDGGNGDGTGDGFPIPDFPTEGSDPRDFGDANIGAVGQWSLTLKYFDAGNNPPCNQVPLRTVLIPGYINTPPVRVVTGPPNSTGAVPVSYRTPLATVPVAQDCGVRVEGEPFYIPPADE